ncbi:hypothetical protein D3C86_2256610 [compost metagenome]
MNEVQRKCLTNDQAGTDGRTDLSIFSEAVDPRLCGGQSKNRRLGAGHGDAAGPGRDEPLSAAGASY